MELRGKITSIGSVETYGNTDVRKLVLTTNDKYPQKLEVSFLNDKTSLLDDFKTNDDVTIKINLRGKEHNGKYYTTINGWSMINSKEEITQKDQNPEREVDILF
jgi:hypothetical protein|tara:strand:+ start:2538 stop:2849 length:312 start_codon:yes stop_codon:yes gene_type:complete